jgi:hypothetical protein
MLIPETYLRAAAARVGLPAMVLVMLTASAIAAPAQPVDVQCMGILPDRDMIRWSGAGGEILYEIWRKEESDDYQCINCDALAGPLSANSDGEFIGEAQFDVPDSTKTYRYRLRAVDPNDDSKSAFSSVVMEAHPATPPPMSSRWIARRA